MDVVMDELDKDLKKRNLKLFDYYMREAYKALERLEGFGGNVEFSYTTETRGSWGCQILWHYDCKDTLADIIHETANTFKREGMEPNSLEGIESNPEEY
jgi:hypothetical protein